MRTRLIFLFVFSCLIALKSKAATFTVTSNADAGPGTLREALTLAAANGTATPDIIRFNLPGSLVSDRVIRLKTELPALTSNLTIDGTTQPGAVFGVSDAKVAIEPENSPVLFNALNIYGDAYNNNVIAKDIEIYGLYIRNFAKITNVSNPNNNQGSGIVIWGAATSVTIGAPGKGNVICGNINGISSSNYYNYNSADKITIQSNIIGLLDDGFTANTNMWGVNLYLDKSATIGGPNANMGNVISANVNNVSVQRSYYFNATTDEILIQNNKIGTNFAGTADYKNIPLFQLSAFIQTYGIYLSGSNSGGLSTKIKDNLVSGQRYVGIYIDNGQFIIEGNKIGTNKAGTGDLGNGEGIRIGASSSGSIGGTAAAAANIIAYNTYGIEGINDLHMLITRNSMFCNKDYGISISTLYYQVPFVKVLNFGSNKVSGTATPNSKIELFYADACGFTNCQGKTYITTVNSNAQGEWVYNNPISSPVIATATDANGNTSPFSSLEIPDNDIVIKHLTCAYNGSITITPAYTGLEFHWDKKEQDGSLTDKGNTKNLANLQPGLYQLTVQYPGGCQKTVKLFEIKDNRIKIQNVLQPIPECRQKFFPVNVNYQGGTGNVTFEWKNAAGEIKSTEKSGIVPAGTYTLTIKDDAGCSVTSTAFTITPKPGPDYDESTALRTPARCGEQNGSVTGVTYYQGIGPITYKWRNSAGVVVGTSKDLTGVVSGWYTLEVADQSQCSPYTKPGVSFFVPEVNSITISGGFVTHITCNSANGAITGVQVSSNVDEVQWYDPNGNPMPTTMNNYSNRTNLAAGTYRLHAKRTVTIDGQVYICERDAYFTVNVIPPQTFIFAQKATPTTCGLDNGSILLSFSDTNYPTSVSWLTENDQPIGGFGNQINNLAPGKYKAIFTDIYGCTSIMGPFEVVKTPLLAFADTNNPVASPDECDQNLGRISGIEVTGGVPPYTYKWTNETTHEYIEANTASLTGLGKGSYHLTVTDATPCATPLFTSSIVVDNNMYIPNAPVLKDKRICNPDRVTLSVTNKVAGNYHLYANQTTTEALQTNKTGNFTVQVNQTSDYYVSYSIGSCESARTKVHVEVILVDVTFPNAFSPNNDGVNDFWKIDGLQKFPGSVVQVFTRDGQKVFESKNYATPFTGKQNGRFLPGGVYYYIINLNTGCELLSGNVTIVR
ncbi:gliding motility-associated C-terminal domain-containing protein [Mucilaginibacter conchicola]|uniref:Gliding motility-associated C-terminal domain-containing protein n=1 Tax=Mucilaginibacter conchicola TaxID=2303333 RepID=A0A372NS88_9SPHI|nr:gliding motility-associated C-terminal domain-containing protein [Mucilaginibacter conchicola]RFZ91771.1 gliding motility-associated C-terminal domain-containing protein [Mucilaginibacter conchicola]